MSSPLSHPPDARSAPHPLLALVQDWRLFRNSMLVGLFLAVAMVFAVGPRYTTTASFVPQGSSTGQLRGLAAQFGFDVAGSEGAESPFFYVEILRTKEVLTSVVQGPFSVGESQGDYATFLELSATDSAIRTERAIRELLKRVSVFADRRTGLVTYEVTEESPELSLQVAEALLGEIARYNRETRQSRAAAERRFVESRLAAARKEVDLTEDSLQNFLTKNRQYATSPELTFEFERLQRSVTHRAGVVSSLAQNFEQTRIDEVRDTPVFSMVQPPRLAARADSRGWARNGLLGMFAGLLFALLLRTVWSASDRLRADDPAEYQGWLATVRDIRRNVWRP